MKVELHNYMMVGSFDCLVGGSLIVGLSEYMMVGLFGRWFPDSWRLLVDCGHSSCVHHRLNIFDGNHFLMKNI